MDDEPKPTCKLFSPGQITLATAVGSFIAGAVLMALNYKRLGRPRAAWATVGIAALALQAFSVLLWLFPQGPALNIVFVVGMIVGMNVLAHRYQGAAFREHIRGGGTKASGFAAVGIALVCVVALLGLLAVVEQALLAILSP